MRVTLDLTLKEEQRLKMFAIAVRIFRPKREERDKYTIWSYVIPNIV
jgi:hypothetical protein